MGYVLKAVLSSAQHPEYGQITVPFPIPDEKYDRMIELLEPLEIGDALRQDCRVDELDSFYTVLNRLVGSLVNFDELDYLAKRLDSFDDGEAAQFQGMACKLGVSNIKDFINLTFCCQQATVITDFSDLDAIGRQHYMTMQGGGCRIEELERLDGRKFALDLILNHLEGRITPYGVVYPAIFTAAFSAGAGASAGSIGYGEEVSPTLKGTASGNCMPSILCLNDQGGSAIACSENVAGTLRAQEHGHQPLVFENHGIDARYTGPHSVAPTMSARYGTGGNNVPLVAEPDTIFCITGNAIDRQPMNGGNGIGYQQGIAYTLTATDHLSGYPDK